jgi:hypothetical protein
LSVDTQSEHPSSDPKINKVIQNLNSERKNLLGAQAYIRALQASSRNEAVIQQAHNEVRNAQANIRFLEDELAKMRVSSGGGSTGGDSGMSSPAGPGSPARSMSSQHMASPASPQGRMGPYPGHGHQMPGGPNMGARGSSNFIMSIEGSERPLPPPPPGAPGNELVRMGAGANKNITQLGERCLSFML